jgi:hypothetical protein
MHKMNFEQASPGCRDLGGLSGTTVLVVANLLCAIWGLLLHVRL